MGESKTTVIAERTTIIGSVEGDEDIQVSGKIDGSLRTTGAVEITASGVVQAEVHAKACRVAGVLVGDVHAEDVVELLAGARVVGDLHAPRLMIAAGAAYRGRVEMGEPAQTRLQPTARSAKPTPAPAPAKENGIARSSAILTRPAPAARTEKQAVAPRLVTAAAAGKSPPALTALPGGKRHLKKK
jgi:cytoskeletal protein CcmA (bactofilin family)